MGKKTKVEDIVSYLNDCEFKFVIDSVTSSTGYRIGVSGNRYPIKVSKIALNGPIRPKARCTVLDKTHYSVQVDIPRFEYTVISEELSAAYRTGNNHLGFKFEADCKRVRWAVDIDTMTDLFQHEDAIFNTISNVLVDMINVYQPYGDDWEFEDIIAAVQFKKVLDINGVQNVV